MIDPKSIWAIKEKFGTEPDHEYCVVFAGDVSFIVKETYFDVMVLMKKDLISDKILTITSDTSLTQVLSDELDRS